MNGLLDNELFTMGILAGINLYQEKVITAYKRKEQISINDNLFYMQSGRERLEEYLNKICR